MDANTFAGIAMAGDRELINVVNRRLAELDEYVARGGGNYTAGATNTFPTRVDGTFIDKDDVDYTGGVTKGQVDRYFGALTTLKAMWDTNKGYFYEGSA